MKYALIAMVAFYLVTFGCNPKTEEEGTTSHDTVEHTAVAEAPTVPGNLTVETHTATQTTHQAAPSNQLETTTHKAPAAPADVQITTENVKSAAAPEKAEEKNDQWKIIAQSAATTVLALMNEEPKSKPALVVETPAAIKDAVKSPKASESITTLPCGKKVSQDVAAKYSPCAKHRRPTPQTAVPTEEPELSEAMQKMVNATNDMVSVTRQLVMATQQMLAASKEVAVEVIDTGKDALENAKPAVQNAINEKEIIETVKEVVAATKEAFEATSEALSEALEAQKTQPAPSAIPQQ